MRKTTPCSFWPVNEDTVLRFDRHNLHCLPLCRANVFTTSRDRPSVKFLPRLGVATTDVSLLKYRSNGLVGACLGRTILRVPATRELQRAIVLLLVAFTAFGTQYFLGPDLNNLPGYILLLLIGAVHGRSWTFVVGCNMNAVN